jgi:hypothetical protein
VSLLVQRGELNPLSPTHRREIEAGGRWVAFGNPDPDELIDEIRARNVRSLVTFQRDLAFLRQVPQLEFLVVSSDPRDVSPIHDLPNLRNLSFSGTWGGRLDLTVFARLESFNVNECPKDLGGLDSLFGGHPVLDSLTIGRARFGDLTPFGRLRLRSLGLSGGLTSLAGAEAFATTLERLSLDGAPNLASLAGIERLERLEVASIEGLRHVTTVDWAARLPRLRLLDVFDQKVVESLWPVAGHPTLEFLAFGRVKDLDLEPLARVPHLKLYVTGRYRWNRALGDFPYLHDLPAGDPARLEYMALKLG